MIARVTRTTLGFVAASLSIGSATLPAQQAVPITARAMSRREVIDETLQRGARLALARAEAAAARASLTASRTVPNPSFSAEYTKSTPQRHASIDWPIDLPWLRSRRIGAANEVDVAAQYRLTFERAAAELDADTAYTRALVAQAKSRLSQANAAAGDSLLRMAHARQDAGDASELEVRLAEVFAGQQTNIAAADLELLDSRLLDLQATMGMEGSAVMIALSDSLGEPPSQLGAPNGTPLLVAAAERIVRGAELSVRLERGNIWQLPSLTAGFETHDPSGSEPGTLPTLGFSIPLPFGNRNQGGIAVAVAERERATAALALARTESRIELARSRRERDGAVARLTRDRVLLTSADRVAAMSLVAYREGAATLPSVLEAQRNAREVVAQYLDDLAAVWVATARLRTLSLTAPQ